MMPEPIINGCYQVPVARWETLMAELEGLRGNVPYAEALASTLRACRNACTRMVESAGCSVVRGCDFDALGRAIDAALAKNPTESMTRKEDEQADASSARSAVSRGATEVPGTFLSVGNVELIRLLRARYETMGDTLARKAADEIEFLAWHSELCREDAARFYHQVQERPSQACSHGQDNSHGHVQNSSRETWSCPASVMGCTFKPQCRAQGWCTVAGSCERIQMNSLEGKR